MFGEEEAAVDGNDCGADEDKDAGEGDDGHHSEVGDEIGSKAGNDERKGGNSAGDAEGPSLRALVHCVRKGGEHGRPGNDTGDAKGKEPSPDEPL